MDGEIDRSPRGQNSKLGAAVSEPESVGLSAADKSDLRHQVSQDLAQKMAEFNNRSAALTTLEKHMGLSKRQISRYLNKESTPQVLSLYAIYSYLCDESNPAVLLKKVPPIVAKEISARRAYNHQEGEEQQFHQDFSEEMVDSPAFLYIYWATADGAKLSLRDVENKFGEYGTKTLTKMIKSNVVRELGRGMYGSGEQRSRPINMVAAKKVVLSLIENHFCPDRTKVEGQNYLGFNVLPISEKYRNTVLTKALKFNNEMIELSQQSESHEEHFFSVVCIDSLEQREKNEN